MEYVLSHDMDPKLLCNCKNSRNEDGKLLSDKKLKKLQNF